MRRIITGEHCFGCTAGSGSSCGGNTGIIQKRDDLGINLGAGSSTTFFIDCELWYHRSLNICYLYAVFSNTKKLRFDIHIFNLICLDERWHAHSHRIWEFSVAKRKTKTGEKSQMWKDIKIPGTKLAKFKHGIMLKRPCPRSEIIRKQCTWSFFRLWAAWRKGREKVGYYLQEFCRGSALPFLPASKSAGVNTKAICQLL